MKSGGLCVTIHAETPMMKIEVLPPSKTEFQYEFRYILRGLPLTLREVLRRARTLLRGYGALHQSIRRFGFRGVNFRLRHSELWDSLYPLMFLTRNGGPLFNKGHDRATIVFHYPVIRKVRDFYVRRAADFGIDVQVIGPVYDRLFDTATDGHVLAFGGGKDSRMILGVLRELGCDPTVVTAGAENVPDIPVARIAQPFTHALADRMMPALMSLGRRFYVGTGLGEAHLETPWHQYFDWASPQALKELSGLLASLGIQMEAEAPAAVLPYNIIQRILWKRYPGLYVHQRSVVKDERSEKNLHVSLCKYYHGISFESHCSPRLFRSLLGQFVERQLAEPSDFGFRNHREPIQREMRAIIHARRDELLLADVRGTIPADWAGAWIDYIHTYVSPQLDARFTSIYEQYAKPIDAMQPSAEIRRIAV
jgi:hypothetical protein